MTDHPETHAESAHQGPAAAARMNGKQSHSRDDSLASEVLRESALTLRTVEAIEGRLATLNLQATVITALALLTLAIVAVSVKRGDLPS